jgi:hypothetical protein
MDTNLLPPTPLKAQTTSPASPAKPVDRRYAWEVIHDPSGDFLGRRFQISDLLAGARQDTWPIGIIFEHVFTKARRKYTGARVILDDSEKQEVLSNCLVQE